MSNLTAQSLRAATSLIVSSKQEIEPFNAVEVYAKHTMAKVKSNTINEKSELQKLNAQLQIYLENVRILEALNKRLMAEVERARNHHGSSVSVSKTSSYSDIDIVRGKVSSESVEAVKFKTRIADSEALIAELNQRIKFYQTESESQKQKIYALQNQLESFKSQREHLVRSAINAEEEIAREKGKQQKAEKDLETLRINLREARTRNRIIQAEIKNLAESLSFSKQVYTMEKSEVKVIPGVTIDVADFYRNELAIAVREIREDFNRLSEQQIQEYKEQKEYELSIANKAIEYEKAVALKTKSKIESSMEMESQMVAELQSSMSSHRNEMSHLNSIHAEMSTKLNSLEERLMLIQSKNREKLDELQDEIDRLLMENESYASDIDYWFNVTKAKLESEIQTYRSILNCQIKLLQNSNLSYETYLKKISTGQSASSGTTTTTTYKVSYSTTDAEHINILRQVFNYFDSDKSGTINVSELDRILAKLNVKLSKEAYQKLMSQVDRNGSRDLDFNEFCTLMLPVFTGKFDDEDLWYAFKKFDLDGSGYITVSELKKILSNIGQNFSEYEIETMIRKVDSNFDGKLSFNEFCRLMKSPAFK